MSAMMLLSSKLYAKIRGLKGCADPNESHWLMLVDGPVAVHGESRWVWKCRSGYIGDGAGELFDS